MAKTNSEYVEFAISVIGCWYMYGVNDQIITEALIQAKAKQYPTHYTAKHIEELRKHIGERAFDCSAITDTFMEVDRKADGWLLIAPERGSLNYNPTIGPIRKIPEIIGLTVHKSGHMGTYVGNGLVVEAKGTWDGVVYTKIAERGWKSWAKVYGMEYEKESDILLQRGDMGQDVYDYQVAIKYLGYYIGTFDDMILTDANGEPLPTGCDGSFGSVMETVTKEFQLNNNLPQTGVVDDDTYGKLAMALVAKSMASKKEADAYRIQLNAEKAKNTMLLEQNKVQEDRLKESANAVRVLDKLVVDYPP